MILQHLAALIRFVFIFHGLSPNASGYPANNTVFRIHSIAEEERKIGRKFIYMHPPAQVIFNISESIGQCESKLRYRVGSGFRNMISANADAVKVADLVRNEIGLHISHQLQCKLSGKYASVLRLVFLQNIRLHSSSNL